MTNRPSAGKPGGTGLGDDERLTLRVIERWRQNATEEVDDIGGWRDADPSDRYHKYWCHPARQKDTEHGSTLPNWFFGDTTYLMGWAASRHEKLDPTPLQDIYDAIAAWHADHNAERVPEQRVLVLKLDRAVQVVHAMQNALMSAARRPPSGTTEWQSDRDRLRYLVSEMQRRIADAASWTETGEVHRLQDEASTLALKLGFPNEPLRLTHHGRDDPDFDKCVTPDISDALSVLTFTQNDPLGAFSIGMIGCIRPGEVRGERVFIEVDFIFDSWKADATRSLEAWVRAIDGLRDPGLPAAAPTVPVPEARDWEATLRRVHELVRAAPERFRGAGEWLDTEYGEEAVRERCRRSQAGESTGHVSASHTSCMEPGKDTRFLRLNCVGSDWRAEPPNLSMRSLDEPRVWAERVLLYICLVTDRAAGEYAADLTELASLPWEKGVDGDLGRGWCDPDDVWDGKEPWRDLVLRATDLVPTVASTAPSHAGGQRQTLMEAASSEAAADQSDVEVDATSNHRAKTGEPPGEPDPPPASREFVLRDEHLTVLAELNGRGVAMKATELNQVSGLPNYDRLLDLLGELERGELVIRPRGPRSGYAITNAGRELLAARGLTD